MSKPTINGQKPLSEKKKTVSQYSGGYKRNLLDLPADLTKELKSQGLEHRWIAYKPYVDNYGFHRNGWEVYKTDKQTRPDGAINGNHPDGIIRRGDLVLAVRSTETNEQHKADLRMRREILKGKKSAAAQQLKQMARESFSNAKVYEGYEENE